MKQILYIFCFNKLTFFYARVLCISWVLIMTTRHLVREITESYSRFEFLNFTLARKNILHNSYFECFKFNFVTRAAATTKILPIRQKHSWLPDITYSLTSVSPSPFFPFKPNFITHNSLSHIS